MPPQNVAQMLDNSHLEVTFDKFVKYLISEKIVKIGQVENLSIQQLKTVYNLNCKYHEEFSNSGSIIEFEDLRKFAVVKQKLIVRAEELLIPSFNIKTRNIPRKDFDKQLDGIAKKIRQKEDQLMKDKAVRVQLDRKRLVFLPSDFQLLMMKNRLRA